VRPGPEPRVLLHTRSLMKGVIEVAGELAEVVERINAELQG
jgi:hypothetical protein